MDRTEKKRADMRTPGYGGFAPLDAPSGQQFYSQVGVATACAHLDRPSQGAFDQQGLPRYTMVAPGPPYGENSLSWIAPEALQLHSSGAMLMSPVRYSPNSEQQLLNNMLSHAQQTKGVPNSHSTTAYNTFGMTGLSESYLGDPVYSFDSAPPHNPSLSAATPKSTSCQQAMPQAIPTPAFAGGGLVRTGPEGRYTRDRLRQQREQVLGSRANTKLALDPTDEADFGATASFPIVSTHGRIGEPAIMNSIKESQMLQPSSQDSQEESYQTMRTCSMFELEGPILNRNAKSIIDNGSYLPIFGRNPTSSLETGRPQDLPGRASVVRSSRPDRSTPSSSPDANTLRCTVEGCESRFTKTYKRGNLSRHMRNKHGGKNGAARVFECADPLCSSTFKRQDARLKHYLYLMSVSACAIGLLATTDVPSKAGSVRCMTP
ncbi:hypothetical protein M011DRAFT_85131 [Sporormia fimetaria CBS 119925]|uniref:C2H2-type domain-containing protein n=1 Tax=Sporormia fimetaria CBS 119925 TaxID=1340428 RepID=A0A6A6V9U3_9PLEO|nr:hypothetical protein M011DRAFT_85131 [Sporormia fimetaria CBS 119925]